jgi:hypothetical protein
MQSARKRTCVRPVSAASYMLIAAQGLSTQLFAGDALGTLAEVHAGPVYGTRVFLRVSGSVTGQPSCHNNHFHFVFDSSTPGGKDLLAMALLAKASQAAVRINGFNLCNHYGAVEDLRWLTLE